MDTVLPLHSNYCIVALRLKKSQCIKEMLCKFFGTQTLFKFVVKKCRVAWRWENLLFQCCREHQAIAIIYIVFEYFRNDNKISDGIICLMSCKEQDRPRSPLDKT